jgi:DNA-binding NtrC family response regulator
MAAGWIYWILLWEEPYLEWSCPLNHNATLLVIDDEESQLIAIGGFLRKIGYTVITSRSAEDALPIFEREPIDLVISDMRMSGMSGLELLQKIKPSLPDTMFILMTAYGTVDNAVESIKQGAFNYLTKPIDLNQLEISITKALESRRLIAENRQLKDILKSRGEANGIISASDQMDQILNIVARVSPTTATVLIQGESGTGKERIAQAIHYGSPRSDKPMVTINCAAVPETLLESELFGHERGAFTGAHAVRKGKLEFADGGTLFIDEIGDIPLSLQPKLLRFLQEGTVERLGSAKTIKLDIRVIAATHRDLRQMVKEDKFREDLFYRLNVVNIVIPPLRERKDDVILLTEHFIKLYSQKNSKKIFGLTREAKDALIKHSFPGNVRELENAIEAAVVLTRNEALGLEDLPISFREINQSAANESSDSLLVKLEAIEKKLITEALQKNGGNKSQAARELGISEKNIRDRLKKWDQANQQ